MNDLDLSHPPLPPEPTLTDYWIVILRRRRLLLTITIVMTAAGIWYGSTRPSLPYPHRTVIEVEDAPAFLSKIQQVYLPIVLEEDASQRGYTERQYDVAVEGTDNLVTFTSFGSAKSSPDILSIHQRVANLLIENYNKRLEEQRRELEKRKFQKELERDSAKSQETFIAHKLQRIEEMAKLLNQQIAELTQSASTLEQKKQVLIAGEAQRPSTAESLATTLILLENDLKNIRDTIMRLQERRAILLKEEGDTIEIEQFQLKQRQQVIQKDFEQLQFELSNIREARLLLGPTRLIRKPQDQPKNVILFALGVGLLLGFTAVFFVEFHQRAVTHLRQLRQ